MSLRFLNTYSRQLEEFAPLDPAGKAVRIYTCGPTVYNHAHIGNFRAYVFEDLLQQHLEARGYDVLRVMNLTDVDDKTIRGARQAGRKLADFTAVYKAAFFEDLDALRIKRAQHFPAATEPQHIAKMIAMISDLEGKGIAYRAEDGSVYFRLSKFPDYGKLAHLNLDELRPSGRIASDEYEKESLGDFALWKAWAEADGDVQWDSPWGLGRPGWHIECSAMAIELLGPEIDIHCGGVDNIFPHHEAEIAQSESCTGKKFVRTWLHCAHLMVEGQKMSKSLGNFYTLRDLLAKGWSGREVRFALLTVNYRLPLNFTFDGLAAGRTALHRIDEWVLRLEDFEVDSAPVPLDSDDSNMIFSPKIAPPEKPQFFEALDDDLNISAALGVLFDVIRDTNRRLDKGEISKPEALWFLDWWRQVNKVLRIEAEAVRADMKLLELLDQRTAARAAKSWSDSDRLRDEIAALGWVVKDTKDGPKLSPR